MLLIKGQVIEQGKHKELLNNYGYYYNLWTGQSIENLDEIAATINN